MGNITKIRKEHIGKHQKDKDIAHTHVDHLSVGYLRGNMIHWQYHMASEVF